MSNIYKNLIEYSGISNYIPKDISCYREFNVDSIVNLTKDRPKIDEIIKISASHKINSTRIIKTPIGKSLEGQELTGKKYMIEGELNFRVDYLSENEDSKVYCTYYKEYFATSIVLQQDIINSTMFIPTIFIEEINGEVLNNEQVLIITTILASVEI